MARTTPGSLVGQEIGGHEIVQLLGAGGMGEVYLARHKVLGVPRAIKVLQDQYQAGDANAAARFQREAMALAQLQHPGVVQVVDYGRLPNGWPFLCMEYIVGPTLDERIERDGPMGLPDALAVLVQLARVLQFAHGRGMVHRDLKPENVLLRNGDPHQPTVIDFGLVRLVSREMMTKLTADRQVVGSPLFMAPEQASGMGDITGAADVYALAGIAYVLLSGDAVFSDRPILALIVAHGVEAPQRLSTRCPGIPKRLDDVLLACLAKKPADRPSAEELVAHLSALQQEVGVGGQTAPPPVPAMAMDRTMMASAGQGPAVPLAPAPAAREPRPGASGIRQAPMAPIEAAPAGVAEAGDWLLSPSGADPTGVLEALANQSLAVVMDLAVVLAAQDPELSSLLGNLEPVERRLSDLEIDTAVLEAELADASGAAHAALEQRCAEAHRQGAALREQVAAIKGALLRRVGAMRAAAPASASHLFDELDALITRANETRRSLG
jgi:hypothetical protein